MYLRFYGLRELPFELTPNPKFLYLTQAHREALANLQYGLSTAKAVTVVTGEAGTGKTTLIRTALESSACREVQCIHLTNPGLTRNEFVEMLAKAFGLSAHAALSKAALLAELEAILRQRRTRNERTALIVDEAQRLSEELLEEIRLLANIESATEKLLPLVLVGQPELAERLNQPGLRQLKQRVALRCDLPRLSLAETAACIAFRIRTAGGDAARLFTREAVVLIHELSLGIPRTVSVICDNALLNGFAAGRHPVSRDMVAEVAKDFDLRHGSLAEQVVVREEPSRLLQADPVEPATLLQTVPDVVGEEVLERESGGDDGAASDPPASKRFTLFGTNRSR
jgi:type II secretory pathway predicted ATPase ExeA